MSSWHRIRDLSIVVVVDLYTWSHFCIFYIYYKTVPMLHMVIDIEERELLWGAACMQPSAACVLRPTQREPVLRRALMWAMTQPIRVCLYLWERHSIYSQCVPEVTTWRFFLDKDDIQEEPVIGRVQACMHMHILACAIVCIIKIKIKPEDEVHAQVHAANSHICSSLAAEDKSEDFGAYTCAWSIFES